MTHDSAPKTDGSLIRWAGMYDAMVAVVSLGREGRMRRQTLALADLAPGQSVLDVGCGTGTLAIAAAQLEPGAQVSGIDPAHEMVARARKKAALAQMKVQFDVGVIEALEVEAESCDVVMSTLMLHHLPGETLDAGLRECFRVTKPGGRLVVVDFRGLQGLSGWLANLRRSRPFAGYAASLRDRLHAVGFADVVAGTVKPAYLFSLVAKKAA